MTMAPLLLVLAQQAAAASTVADIGPSIVWASGIAGGLYTLIKLLDRLYLEPRKEARAAACGAPLESAHDRRLAQLSDELKALAETTRDFVNASHNTLEITKIRHEEVLRFLNSIENQLRALKG